MIMKKIFLLIVLTTIVMRWISAQTPTTGNIEGAVTDEATGNPLPGANVLIINTTLGTSTSLDGTYYLGNLPP